MNICLTGAAGFIGSHVLTYLSKQENVDRVISLDALTYAGCKSRMQVPESDKHIFVQTNIRDAGAVASLVKKHRVSHVMHLAAETHVDRSIQSPVDFIQTNIVGTFNLLEAARGYVEKFIYVSTDEVYGDVLEGYSDEQTRLNPSSPYAASKASSELLCSAYQRTYGVPVIIVRPSNNYGPGQHREKFIPTIIHAVRENKPVPIYGDGVYSRDWLYVTDHAQALMAILRNGKVGEAYNVSSNKPISNMEIAHAISSMMGKPKMDREHVADRAGHDRRYAPDAAKMRRLGWEPKVELAQGLQLTIDSYLQ